MNTNIFIPEKSKLEKMISEETRNQMESDKILKEL